MIVLDGKYRTGRPRLLAICTSIVLLSFSSLNARQEDTPVFALNRCVEAALNNNPQLISSALTAEESRVYIDEVKAGFYPTLSWSARTGTTTWENSATGTGTVNRDNWESGLSLQYPLSQGFKTIATVNAAEANYQVDQAQHHVNRQDLVMAVTEAYYRLLQAERLVKVAEQSVERALLHLDFAHALFETGLASRSDILKAKVTHSDAQLALISARNARLAVRGQLNLHMGRAVQLPLEIVDDLETVDSPVDSSFLVYEDQFEKSLQHALQNRPEYDRMDKLIKAQRAYIRLARKDYFPALYLDGRYDYAGETVSDLSSSAYIGMSVSFPLFDGFSRPARVTQENLALQNLTQQQESIRQQISLEVWNAYYQLKEAIERVANSRIYYENALENRDIAEGEYREGMGSMLDVIDAQTALVNSEQTFIEALVDYRISLAMLDRATGVKDIEESLK